MYHSYDPWGVCVALFSGSSWISILVPGDSNGVQSKLKMTKSCSWADKFGFIMDLRMIFRVVVSWSKSISQIYNEKFGITLYNLAMQIFSNICTTCSVYLCRCMFGVTNWKSIFLSWQFEWGCWKLHCQFLKALFQKFGC